MKVISVSISNHSFAADIYKIYGWVSIAINVQRNLHIEKYVYKFVYSFGNL